MDISELFGLLVAFFAVFATILSLLRDLRRRMPSPSEVDESEKDAENAIDRFLRSDEEEEELDDEELEEGGRSLVPPPAPLYPELEASRQKHKSLLEKLQDEPIAFERPLERYRPKTAIDERQLDIKIRGGGEGLISRELQVGASEGKFMQIHPRRHALEVIKLLDPRKAMVVSHAIFSPPLSLNLNHLPWQKW